MKKKYTIGIDYGTASVRAIIVDVSNGEEIGSGVYNYKCGTDGAITNPKNPLVVRQDPREYIKGLEQSIKIALSESKKAKTSFKVENVIGLGIDTTGTTLLPVLQDGTPLVELDEFKNNLNSYIWLWKDHSSWAEAEEITTLAKKFHPEYMEMVGGTYSSEWFWSKILHSIRIDKTINDTAYTWVEVSDWLMFKICNGKDISTIKRGVCAAGHKALYNPEWNGYPDRDFLVSLDQGLGKIYDTLKSSEVLSTKYPAGTLSSEWTKKLGLEKPVVVAMPAFDAHFGGIGAGIKPGVLVKTIGTSTCDLMISPIKQKKPTIPGMAGIVLDSIVPGYYGIEAGQSAVGDIFNWFVKYIQPSGMSYKELTHEAQKLQPGESGLLALDWHNGNRTILVDQQLTGLILGLNLQTSPAEIYRSLIEATAFGARIIHEQMENHNLNINEIIVCGGIPRKDKFLMQTYADILGKPLYLSRNTETCALGGAISAAVVAGVYPVIETAMEKMTAKSDVVYYPIPEHQSVYNELFSLYLILHDSFSAKGTIKNLSKIMKDLMAIKRKAS